MKFFLALLTLFQLLQIIQAAAVGPSEQLQHVPSLNKKRDIVERGAAATPIPKSYPKDLQAAIKILQALPYGGQYFCQLYLAFDPGHTSTVQTTKTASFLATVTDKTTTVTSPTVTITAISTEFDTVSTSTLETITNTETDTSTLTLTSTSVTQDSTTTTYDVVATTVDYRRNYKGPSIPKQLGPYLQVVQEACYYIQTGSTTPPAKTKTATTSVTSTKHTPQTITQTAATATATATATTTTTTTVTGTETQTATSTTVTSTTTTTTTTTTATAVVTGSCSVPQYIELTNQPAGEVPTYYNYYAGSGYTLNPNNPGNNAIFQPITRNYNNGPDDCTTVNEMFVKFAFGSITDSQENYFTTDCGFHTDVNLWMCTAYYNENFYTSYYNVQNPAVSKSFGYYLSSFQ